ncbi:MAG: hypothetical protein BWY45_02688 [Euryarchaeota archaeon ADurb.Bin294]|nr:MAG: hypothetical protein BWY45_02688 [Euryarchaeota archaeon ADurb.Bin294]
MCRPARDPSCSSARRTAADPIDTAPRLMPLILRASDPAWIALLIQRVIRGSATDIDSDRLRDFLSCPRIWSSPMTIESRPAARSRRWDKASASFHICHPARPSLSRKVPRRSAFPCTMISIRLQVCSRITPLNQSPARVRKASSSGNRTDSISATDAV